MRQQDESWKDLKRVQLYICGLSVLEQIAMVNGCSHIQAWYQNNPGSQLNRELLLKMLMLGWEFPPFISGGLGTACYGLTKVMSQKGIQITFVISKASETGYSSYIKMLGTEGYIQAKELS